MLRWTVSSAGVLKSTLVPVRLRLFEPSEGSLLWIVEVVCGEAVGVELGGMAAGVVEAKEASREGLGERDTVLSDKCVLLDTSE